jgi:hypothetical protein
MGGAFSGFLGEGYFSWFFLVFYLKAYYSQGQRSLLIFLFNTLSSENELECHFRKDIKFRYQMERKILGPNKESDFKIVSNNEFYHLILSYLLLVSSWW